MSVKVIVFDLVVYQFQCICNSFQKLTQCNKYKVCFVGIFVQFWSSVYIGKFFIYIGHFKIKFIFQKLYILLYNFVYWLSGFCIQSCYVLNIIQARFIDQYLSLVPFVDKININSTLINLDNSTIAPITYSCRNVANSGTSNLPNLSGLMVQWVR